VEIDLAEIRELIAIVNQSNVTELVIESEDFKLSIRKSVASAPVASMEPGAASQEIPGAAPGIPTTPATPPEEPAVENNFLEVKAPMVGTFYRAPSPEASPFVQINDRMLHKRFLERNLVSRQLQQHHRKNLQWSIIFWK